MHIQKHLYSFFCASYENYKNVKRNPIPKVIKCDDFDTVIKRFEAYRLSGDHNKIVDEQKFIIINRLSFYNSPSTTQLEVYRKWAVNAVIDMQRLGTMSDEYYYYGKSICTRSESNRIYQSPHWKARSEQIKVKREREQAREKQRWLERYHYRKAKFSYPQTIAKAEAFYESKQYDKIIDLYKTREHFTQEQSEILWEYVIKAARCMRIYKKLSFEDYQFFWNNASFFDKLKFSF